jgi:predicted component of type VI protein secretion system
LRGTKIEPSCHAIGFRASRDLRVAILKHWANENDK